MLVTFEKSVSDIDVMADISTFIEKQKKVELTHKYAKAVSLMDWDYQRRCAPDFVVFVLFIEH